MSSISAVSAAAEQARVRASQEPNQDSYNAAWLHGYAQALADTARQLESPQRVDTPIEISGVLDSPNDENSMVVRFIDSEYHPLFTVPDGANIVVTALDGTRSTLPCRYIDDYHARIGDEIFHIHQFAIDQEQKGMVYMPEQPSAADLCDTYEIYQLKDVGKTVYSFCSYEAAKDRLRPSHYIKVYAGVLVPGTTLEDLYTRHNQDLRPRRMEMRSMSVSDVVVLNKGGVRNAYYVDSFGFHEAKQFLKPPARNKNRSGQER